MLLRPRVTRTHRRVAPIAVLAFILNTLVWIAVAAPPAEATTAPFQPQTNFEIDGNYTGLYDWSNLPYGPYTTAQGYQSAGIVAQSSARDDCVSDTSGYPGSQTQDSNPWLAGAAAPNKKADLCAGGASVEIVNVNGQYQYIYHAYWARRPDGTGDLNVFTNLEGPAPGRGDDRLIAFDYAPSNNSVTVTVLSWNGSSWVLTDTLNSTEFQSAVGRNTEAANGGNATAGNGTFAEVAVNLTTAGVLPDDSCSTFSASSSISRTGNSSSAQLEDYLAFNAPLTIRSCGKVTITKNTDPAYATGGPFGYELAQADGGIVHDNTLAGDGDSGATEPDTNYTSIRDTLTIPGDSTDTWTGVLAEPDYTLRETAMPDGWRTQSISCSYYDLFTRQMVTRDVTGGQQFQIPSGSLAPDGTRCTITNETSTVTIAKQGAGSSTDEFTFNVAGKPDQQLQLNEHTPEMTFTPGTPVQITENLPNTAVPWKTLGVRCVDDSTGQVVAQSSTGTVTPTTVGGHNITCTYINQQMARIRVTKNIAPDNAAATFDFTGAVNATLGDGQSSPYVIVDPNTGVLTGAPQGGTYAVTEQPDGTNRFNLSAISCSDTDSTGDLATATADFKVSPGETVNCTFLNTEAGTLTIIKKAVPQTDLDFGFTSPDIPGGSSFSLNDSPDNGGRDHVSFVNVPSGTYHVTEGPTSGWDLTGISCSDTNSKGDVATGQTTVVMDPGESVTCVYTNTRRTAQLTLTKEWVNSAKGDEVDLTSQGQVDTHQEVGHSTSIGPNDPNGETIPAVRTVYANSDIKLTESYHDPVIATHYNTTLRCTDAAGLTYDNAVDPYTGTYHVPANPQDVTCTFVNSAKMATLRLQKSWGGA